MEEQINVTDVSKPSFLGLGVCNLTPIKYLHEGRFYKEYSKYRKNKSLFVATKTTKYIIRYVPSKKKYSVMIKEDNLCGRLYCTHNEVMRFLSDEVGFLDSEFLPF